MVFHLSYRIPIIGFLFCLFLPQTIVAMKQQDIQPQSNYIIAGFPKEFPPYYFINDKNQAEGFAIEYIEVLAKKLGLSIKYQPFNTWQETLTALKANQINLIPNMGDTPERRQFALILPPIETFEVAIFVRKTALISSIEELSDKIVGVVESNVAKKILQHETQFQLKIYHSSTDALFDLIAGNIDALAYPAPVVWKELEDIGLEDKVIQLKPSLIEIKRSIGVAKEQTQLFSRLERELPKFIHSAQYQAIYSKWFSKPEPYWNASRVFWIMLIITSLFLILLSVLHYFKTLILNKHLLKEIRQRQRAETQLKQINDNLEKQAVLEEITRYESVLSATQDGYWVVDLTGKIHEVNDAYCKLSGYDREELLQMSIWQVDFNDQEQEVQERMKAIIDQKNIIFETWHQHKNGELFPVEISVSYTPVKGGQIVSFIRDIHERKTRESIAKLKQELSEIVYSGNHEQLMRQALDTAESLSHSQIGFFHFVEADQETISLQVWSSRTLSEMCFAEGNGLHYPISEAGVWVDCIYARKPVIHDDYSKLKHKKGLPKGHAALDRELTIPVIQDNQIIAVIGVGNKQTPYQQQDVEIVQQIADLTMQFVQRMLAKEQVERMAYYDILTNIPNRALMLDRLHQAISNADRNNSLLAVCYLDLDGFKPINDKYGHDVGDKLLQKLAQLLENSIRDGDTLARMGGDEFVILLANLNEFFECDEILQRILNTVNTPLEIAHNRLQISASIGVTLYPTDKSDPDTLLRHADQAMYQVKNETKANYKVFDAVHHETIREQQQLLNEFEIALQNNQLELYYQPKINLSSAEVIGVEGLIRWNHPERGLLSPGHFLPMIENSPFEISLGEWVIKKALHQLNQWQQQQIFLTMSVNISPRHLQLENFAAFMQKELAVYHPELVNFVELEILETANIDNTHQVAKVMNACVELGLKFSLDDFGTGYSSLTYFHQLPISILKIDQDFVKDMLDDSDDLDIVEGVVHLARTLDRPVVAEGVESIELGMMLMQLGCDYAQGYGIAKPMPAQQLPKWITSWQDKGNIWHQLTNNEDKTDLPYDIHVAIFSHQLWSEKIQAYLTGDKQVILPNLDDNKCQFYHWYQGIGKRRYGSQETYAFIHAKHTAVHVMAKDLIQLFDKNKKTDAAEKFKELEKLSAQFIAMLQNLNL